MDERKPPIKLPVLGASNESSPEDGVSRRRFLALFSASAALATGAGCGPAKGRAAIVPYTKKQEEIVPGIADYYASAFQEGEVAYPVLVKAREGRPIHVEGNDEHPLYKGKTSFRATADLLGLYDPDRLRGPQSNGRPCTWKEAIDQLARGLKDAPSKSIALVMPALLSPSRKALLARLVEALPGMRQVRWEPAADHAGRQAEQDVFGEIRLPRYAFDKADVILSLEADFLGTLGDTVSAIAGFAGMRRPASFAGGMNRLYVLEGGMSLTGAKADVRLPMRPSALARIAFGLVRAIHLKGGRPLPAGLEPSALEIFALDRVPEAKPFSAQLEALVKDLCAAGDKALVLAGPAASAEAHAACLILNSMLGAQGSTVLSEQSVAAPALALPGEFKKLVEDMAAGRIAAVLFWDVNPAYDFASSDDGDGAWKAAVSKVPLRVRLGMLPDETATSCNLVLPVNHWLESWNDFETSREALTLQQPIVTPLYDTLQGEDVLLRCLAELGRPQGTTYLDFLKKRWQDEVQPKGSPIAFARFWNASLHDGLFRRKGEPLAVRNLNGKACARAAASAAKVTTGKFELVLDTDPRLYDGRYANNGWLQELPDPITKTSWGNPLSMSLADADRLHLKNGDLVTLGKGTPLPILRQPGQADGVLRLFLGHGRWQGSVASGVGARAWTFALETGVRVVTIASVGPTGGNRELALSQGYDTKDGRDIARVWSLAEFAKKPQHDLEREELPSMYDKHEQQGPRWGMAIDLSSCVGCGGCVVACQSENNIPVVGPEQVRKGRAMHWIRIDRYYDGEEGSSSTSPSVVHEPILCQHCDNAPCETVCPVQATNHGPDGINQMAYNRCVGTRYCANNCPYKVRRFNFLDFTSETPASMQLAYNPEVTVRPRGVMEKCTFCVQRIRNATHVAKREGRELRDKDVVPACGAACPASAIVFGDIADPNSEVSKLSRNNRSFHVLEELGTKPAITYLASLKNPSGRVGVDGLRPAEPERGRVWEPSQGSHSNRGEQ
jgi:molybdopterin-containing oxidoreductase family iron-sulfur binding subunit